MVGPGDSVARGGAAADRARRGERPPATPVQAAAFGRPRRQNVALTPTRKPQVLDDTSLTAYGTASSNEWSG